MASFRHNSSGQVWTGFMISGWAKVMLMLRAMARLGLGKV
jgi:hypothetical protein